MFPSLLISKNVILALLVLMLAGTCVKELDLKVKDQGKQLVVYGNFTYAPGERFVSIRRTADFGLQISEKVSGAKVFLVDEQNRRLPFNESENGDYRFADASFQAVPGRKYHLEIELKDGEKFRSEPSAMPAPLKIKRSYFEFIPAAVAETRPSIGIMIDLDVPANPEGTYLRWSVQRIWQRTSIDLATLFQDYFRFKPPVRCYLTDSLSTQALPLFGTPRTGALSILQQQVVSIELDNKFWEKNGIEIIQYHSSPEAYAYWSDVKLVANQQGTIFDPPPAAVLGNIYRADDPGERILGFFELTAVDTSYVFVEKGQLKDFGYFVPDPCIQDYSRQEWWDTFGFSPSCAFCVNIVGHSTVRPPFWR
jgi:Domain of unknown function (DUF4249)